MQLRILCLGAGATGGYYGGRLIQANAAHVSFLLRTKDQAAILRERGLTVLSPFHGDVTVRNFPAFASIEDDRSQHAYDVILLSCKSYDLEAACDKLDPFVRKHSQAIVLPVLNGLAHIEYLEQRFGPERIVGGVSHVATTIAETGVIKQLTKVHRITFGARTKRLARTDAILQALHTAFKRTPVEVRLVSNIDQELWEKFVLLATLAGSTCLARAAVGDIMNTDEGEHIVRSMLQECIVAADKAGFPPRLEEQREVFDRLTERNSVLTASMMRDMESDRPTEAKHIVFDMLQRVRAAGNPGMHLAVAWHVLQARNERLHREKGIRHRM